jgi:Ala-tRNA(Pro) deacylase
MACREALETYLREKGVEYEVQQHPLAFTAQAVAATEHIPGRMLAKVVMVLADEDLHMLVLPANLVVDLDAASRALGGRQVRLAREQDFASRFPDCDPGAMPPFGNLYGIPVLFDDALGRNERIVFQAGSHTETISIAYSDLLELVQPTIAPLAFVSPKAARAS